VCEFLNSVFPDRPLNDPAVKLHGQGGPTPGRASDGPPEN